MEQARIDLIYEVLINESELTTNSLQKYGLKESEIESFISSRIIEPINYKTFKLVSIEKLRRYGVKLLLTGHKLKANKCFEICYQLYPDGKHIGLQYMLAKIASKKYQEAIEIFMKLEKINQQKNEKDNNLYLYLLGVVTNCIPEELKERNKQMKQEDIILPYLTCNKIENKIRIAISEHKFKYAYELIIKRNQKEPEYSVKYELIRMLTCQAIEVDQKIKTKILYLTKKSQHQEIILLLTHLQSQRQLSKMETSILKLSQNIIQLTNDLPIHQLSNTNTNDIYEAIEANDFKLALDLNIELLEYTKTNKYKNVLYLLLSRLNALIEEKQENEQTNKGKQTIELISLQEEITEQELEDTEALAYYISSQNITLEMARKKIGFLTEQFLLIKLIYARDYYIESNYDVGDKLIKEVEYSTNKTPKVINLLETIKRERDNYKNQINRHKKILTK